MDKYVALSSLPSLHLCSDGDSLCESAEYVRRKDVEGLLLNYSFTPCRRLRIEDFYGIKELDSRRCRPAWDERTDRWVILSLADFDRSPTSFWTSKPRKDA